MISTLYWALSILCWLYAIRHGGQAAFIAFVMFVFMTMGTSFSVPGLSGASRWTGINVSLFLTDTAFLVGLYILALRCRKYWPIWMAGLQLMCVLSHFGPLIDPHSSPAIYRALESVWMIPEMAIMVLGIAQDRRAEVRAAAA
jgi:hypothetical protein